MRVLIAPDSFKGSLSALAAAQSMARGVCSVFTDAVCDLAPIADGGEGTVDALTVATTGEIRTITVRGPLGKPVEVRWGILGNSRAAVVEMAAASGLPLLKLEERNPLLADTYGTGEVIRAALATLHDPAFPGRGTNGGHDKPTLIIGIGGSATNDAGSGALRALGLRFLDIAGKELEPGGAALARLARIDCAGINPLLAKTRIRVACDVDSPLTGERGASAVFGPQKGATPDMVRELDHALDRFAEVARESTGKDLATTPGAGAAGGLGAGLLFFAGAKLEPGINIVLEATDMAAKAAKADFVFTGEGRSDIQTAYGKAPVGVAKIAKRYGKPVICISGSLEPGAEAVYEQGIDALAATVCSIESLEYCMQHAEMLLENTTARVCRTLRVGMQLARVSSE